MGKKGEGITKAFHGRQLQDNNKGREKLAGKLAEVHIEGFKSLKSVELELNDINVFIGSNGAGKSNTLGFFEMLSWMIRGEKLQDYIARKGGADDLLFNGAKRTRSIHACLSFQSQTGKTEYQFRLQHSENNQLIFGEEEYRFTLSNKKDARWESLGVGHSEAKITHISNPMTAQITKRMLSNCTIYQFHDTSATSLLKTGWDSSDINFLRNDGGNLAPILLDLKENHTKNYNDIVNIIRKALPLFRDFDLQVLYGKVMLRWEQQGEADKVFGAHLTSDGTLRMMALITLLCMPTERLPDVILMDEPELGLHPQAISLIGALIKKLATKKQVIIATQSPLLLNEFDIKNVIIARMAKDGGTEFNRLKEEEYKEWLDEFRAGDLWRQNVIGGNL